MAYAVSSSLGSFVSGKLLGLVNYNVVAVGNLGIHTAVMSFLIIWEREPNYAIIFIVPFIWGICFGAWLTITISKELPYKHAVYSTYIYLYCIQENPACHIGNMLSHFIT